MGAKYVFTYPYIVTLDCANLKRSSDWMMWCTSRIGTKPGFGVLSGAPRTLFADSLVYLTVFHAEVSAILVPGRINLEEGLVQQELENPDTLRQWASGSKGLTAELKTRYGRCTHSLYMLASGNNVMLIWVPGQEGNRKMIKRIWGVQRRSAFTQWLRTSLRN